MLLELRAENYAVIDHAIAVFGPGLNLLTGETGAGKSILVDALALLMGEKASSDVVRHGAEKAVVACVFESTDGGQGWAPLYNSAMPNSYVLALALDETSMTLYAGTEHGVWALSNYPALAVAGDGPMKPVLALSAWPNPARSAVAQVRYSLPRPGATRLIVYGPSGERVRRLLDQRIESAGTHAVTWDERDARGRRVAPGIYFLRLESSEGARTARLVIASR